MLRLWLLRFGFKVICWYRIKHHAPNAFRWLKNEVPHKTNLHNELLVLMIDDTKRQHDVETEYYDEE